MAFMKKKVQRLAILATTKKCKIASNDDLQKAFRSGDLRKENQPLFYICRKQEEKAIQRPAEDFGNGKYFLRVFYLCRDIPKHMQRLQSATEHCRLGYKIFTYPSGSIVFVVLALLCYTL